jgi:Ran-binding protein 1
MSTEATVNNAQAAAAAAEEETCTAEFATKVNLSQVTVDDGEKDEDAIHTDRSALYRFDDESKEWKERAKGDIQILKHKETGKCRVIMRQEKTFKLRLNHYVPDESLKSNPGSDKAWTWRCSDSATDSGVAEVFSFAARFRTPADAQKFLAKWEEARKRNVAIATGGKFDESSVAAPAEAEAEKKPEADKKDEAKPAEAAKPAEEAEEKPEAAKAE